MTNEEAITLLKTLKTYHNGTYAKAIYMAIDALQQTTWIPVGERLPDKTDIYLITFGKYETAKAVIASHYFDGEWLSLDHGYVFGTVIAWMPLPEPYKGGDEE